MKLILASMLTKSQNKIEPLLKGARINTALCIPTAANVYDEDKRDWQAEEMNAVRQMGIELEVFDILGKEYNDIIEKLSEHKCVYITGGNTYYLLEQMRLSGFDRALIEWTAEDKVYIGCSAGAVVACPRIDYIRDMDDPKKASLNDFKGLNLYPNLVMVHVDNSHYGIIAKSLMSEWENKGYEIVPLNDDEYLFYETEKGRYHYFKPTKEENMFSKLVLATHNKGKVAEMLDLLKPYGVDVVSAGELGLAEPEETENTFVGNALIKARAASAASGLPVLADDSGLCVNALNGDPGVYSADWAGNPRDFNVAMKKVHDALGDASDRSAYFISVFALVLPDGTEKMFEGRCAGQIVWPPRGSGGHGYDPIFMPDGETRTFGEMTLTEKQKYSHRARAFEKFVEILK